jgi:hypothetical protein
MSKRNSSIDNSLLEDVAMLQTCLLIKKGTEIVGLEYKVGTALLDYVSEKEPILSQ